MARSQVRGRCAIFRSDAEIASPEDYGRKLVDLTRVERAAACQSYLDRAATREMLPEQARRQGSRIVGNDQVAGAQQMSPF